MVTGELIAPLELSRLLSRVEGPELAVLASHLPFSTLSCGQVLERSFTRYEAGAALAAVPSSTALCRRIYVYSIVAMGEGFGRKSKSLLGSFGDEKMTICRLVSCRWPTVHLNSDTHPIVYIPSATFRCVTGYDAANSNSIVRVHRVQPRRHTSPAPMSPSRPETQGASFSCSETEGQNSRILSCRLDFSAALDLRMWLAFL